MEASLPTPLQKSAPKELIDGPFNPKLRQLLPPPVSLRSTITTDGMRSVSPMSLVVTDEDKDDYEESEEDMDYEDRKSSYIPLHLNEESEEFNTQFGSCSISSTSSSTTNTNKQYSCSFCQKTFMRPSSLKIHIYSHTGEKPFHCSFSGCKRRFSVQSNMRRHLRVHSD